MTQSSSNPSRPQEWAKRAEKWLRRENTVLCPRCGFDLSSAPLYREWRVCDNCGHHFPLDSQARIRTLTDPNSFHEIEKYRGTHPRGLDYAQQVRETKRETHLQEAVVIGTARIAETELMLVVLDFRFLGGTMGAAAGEKIARAFEHAAELRLPILVVTATGGARIQEGMNALMQMAKTAAAVNLYRHTGQPYISLLTNPTTGGVYASFANLAHVILAEPHALIGFAGPRVVQVLTHQTLPKDSHRAEFLLEHGMVDGVVPRMEQRAVLAKILGATQGKGAQAASLQVEGGERASPTWEEKKAAPLTPWESVQLARHPERPTALDYIQRIFTEFVELHGDHFFGDDPAIVGGLAQLNGRGVVVIGQERGRGEERVRRHAGHAAPEGYRKAQRLMQLASEWHLPLITFVDTPGADPSYEAEKRGIAMSLAQCLAEMLNIQAPTVAVVIGEGGSGGALALGAADRVLMLEHAVYSVITPEGASAILYGDDAHAEELAENLHLTAPDLKARGIIDEIVAEPQGGAHTNRDRVLETTKTKLVEALHELSSRERAQLLHERYKKYREIAK